MLRSQSVILGSDDEGVENMHTDQLEVDEGGGCQVQDEASLTATRRMNSQEVN